MKEIENNLKSRRLLADSEPIKQQSSQYQASSKLETRKKSGAPNSLEEEDDSFYQLLDPPNEDIGEG